MNSGVPSYFAVDKSYQTIPVGHVSHYSVIVNDPNYDFFVLAGISNNELFSKLVMQNMNISEGRVFDTNINNISSHLPTDKIKIITKNVSAFNTATSDNLQAIISKYKNIFLKLDIGGAEYLWVLTQSQEKMARFKQMIISFHKVNDNPTQARAINKINCFKKILETHNIANIRSHQNKLTITYIRKSVQPVNEAVITTNIEGESSSDEHDGHPIFNENSAHIVEHVANVVEVAPVAEEQELQLVVEEFIAKPLIDTIPEPVVKEPEPQPEPEHVSEPEPEHVSVFEHDSEPEHEPEAEELVVEEPLSEQLADELVIEEPVSEPVVEQVSDAVPEEPVAEPVPEPVVEQVVEEPVVEQVSEEPVAEQISEPVHQEPVVEQVSEPVPEPVPEQVAEPVPQEPVVEQVSEPVSEPVPEQVAEPVTEHVLEEPAPEPTPIADHQ